MLGAVEDVVPAERFETDTGPDPDARPAARAAGQPARGRSTSTPTSSTRCCPPSRTSAASPTTSPTSPATWPTGSRHYDDGRVAEALWWWQFSYLSSWGQHAAAGAARPALDRQPPAPRRRRRGRHRRRGGRPPARLTSPVVDAESAGRPFAAAGGARQRALPGRRAGSDGAADPLVDHGLAGPRRRPAWWPVRVLGAVLCFAGGVVLLQAFWPLRGRGPRDTRPPWHRPSTWSVGGAYRYVRNPMYLAVTSLIVGQALLLVQPELRGLRRGLPAGRRRPSSASTRSRRWRRQFGAGVRRLPRRRARLVAEPKAVRQHRVGGVRRMSHDPDVPGLRRDRR